MTDTSDDFAGGVPSGDDQIKMLDSMAADPRFQQQLISLMQRKGDAISPPSDIEKATTMVNQSAFEPPASSPSPLEEGETKTIKNLMDAGTPDRINASKAYRNNVAEHMMKHTQLYETYPESGDLLQNLGIGATMLGLFTGTLPLVAGGLMAYRKGSDQIANWHRTSNELLEGEGAEEVMRETRQDENILNSAYQRIKSSNRPLSKGEIDALLESQGIYPGTPRFDRLSGLLTGLGPDALTDEEKLKQDIATQTRKRAETAVEMTISNLYSPEMMDEKYRAQLDKAKDLYTVDREEALTIGRDAVLKQIEKDYSDMAKVVDTKQVERGVEKYFGLADMPEQKRQAIESEEDKRKVVGSGTHKLGRALGIVDFNKKYIVTDKTKKINPYFEGAKERAPAVEQVNYILEQIYLSARAEEYNGKNTFTVPTVGFLSHLNKEQKEAGMLGGALGGVGAARPYSGTKYIPLFDPKQKGVMSSLPVFEEDIYTWMDTYNLNPEFIRMMTEKDITVQEITK